jgi:hypothetical protein
MQGENLDNHHSRLTKPARLRPSTSQVEEHEADRVIAEIYEALRGHIRLAGCR